MPHKIRKMQIIDIGVNLMHRSFASDREAIVDDAAFEGVFPLIITGTSERDSVAAVNYATQFPNKLYTTVGVHPHDVKHCSEKTIPTLKRLAHNDCVVAIGECGLDYNRDFSPRDIQRKWFREQIKLAIELNKPLFLHERDALNDFSSILKEYSANLPKTVVHCFTGSEEALNIYLDMGCYIGITGWICDERRGKHLADLVKKIPSDKLMIETDAPFLTPRNMKDQPKHGRNEPKYLVHIAENIARILNMDVEDFAEQTYLNTCRFFNLPL